MVHRTPGVRPRRKRRYLPAPQRKRNPPLRIRQCRQLVYLPLFGLRRAVRVRTRRTSSASLVLFVSNTSLVCYYRPYPIIREDFQYSDVTPGILSSKSTGAPFTRAQTVEFQEPNQPIRHAIGNRSGADRLAPIGSPTSPRFRNDSGASTSARQRIEDEIADGIRFRRTMTSQTNRTNRSSSGGYYHTDAALPAGSYPLRPALTREDVGFGGFPMPHQIVSKLASKAFPAVTNRLQRTMSVVSRTRSQGDGGEDDNMPRTRSMRSTAAPYISFAPLIGRNSRFHDLAEEELEELGGVEYRALMMLLWLVPLVSTKWLGRLGAENLTLPSDPNSTL